MHVRPARIVAALAIPLSALSLSSCGWRGLNSVPLPGTKAGGPGSYTVQAELPDVDNIEQNSRVRVGDVNVGTVTKIERQGWHALVTMTLQGDVKLPANATATIGQTSLLGSLHVELAPPKGVSPEGSLHDGSLIPLSSGKTYPSTEKTLAAVSVVLNGGGIGQVQDITQALSTAFAGRENDLRNLITQLDRYVGYLNDQKGDIIAATDSLNGFAGQIAAQKPVWDHAITTIPNALAVLKDERNHLADALASIGKFSAIAADSAIETKENLVKELNAVGPVFQSLADSGVALTRSMNFYTTFPFPTDTLTKWVRGDYANLTTVVDLTLSRLDAGLFTGTRWEGDLTQLEMQWGRTIGQMPSPYTAANPLVIPYIADQGK